MTIEINAPPDWLLHPWMITLSCMLGILGLLCFARFMYFVIEKNELHPRWLVAVFACGLSMVTCAAYATHIGEQREAERKAKKLEEIEDLFSPTEMKAQRDQRTNPDRET